MTPSFATACADFDLTSTALATIYGTSTPVATATPTLGTPGFFDFLGTPTPSGTPGINLTCPSEPFDAADLDPQWSMVCSACVEAQQGTATPIFGQVVSLPTYSFGSAVSFPTISLDTQTPGATFTPAPVGTATNTPTSTVTYTPTMTATPHPGSLVYVDDFESGTIGAFDSPYGTYNSVVSGGNPGLALNGSSPSPALIVGVVINFPAAVRVYEITWDYKQGAGNGGTTLHYYSAPDATGEIESNDPGSIKDGAWHNALFNPITGSTSAPLENVRSIIAGQAYDTNNGADVWIDNLIVYYDWMAGTPTPSPTAATPTETLTPTITPSWSPTPSPVWWSTSFPLYAGLSEDCSVPKHVDMSPSVTSVSMAMSPSGTSACLTILPDLDIGFSGVNFVTETVLHFSIPDLITEQTQICFVGVSLDITFFGFEVDMSIVVGAPILAFIFRWIMRN